MDAFEKLATAAFPDLTLELSISTKINHRTVPTRSYTLGISGKGLLGALTVSGPDAATAVTNARSQVAKARREYATNCVLGNLCRDWTPDAFADARRKMLEARGVDAFNEVVKQVQIADHKLQQAFAA